MAVDLKRIQQAAARVNSHLIRTPLLESQVYARILGSKAPIYLKAEMLQHTGSFKVRGAANKILSLIEAGKKPSRLFAASAGNHAQAVAYIASKLGIPATIVMPEGAPLVKISSTSSFGADVVLRGVHVNDSYVHAKQLQEECKDSEFVHPYSDEDVICGQGSIGLEINEQLAEHGYKDDALQVVVPIGGGGLFAGCVTALSSLRKNVTAFGVVTEAVPAMAESFKAGKVVESPAKNFTIADGLAVKSVSELNFNLVKNLAKDIVTVSDTDIAWAVSSLIESRKLITEGAGAAGVAAALSRKINLDPMIPTVFVLCGGNIDINRLSRILTRGLHVSRRWLSMRVFIDDIPGELAKVAALLGKMRANVLEVTHERDDDGCPMGGTILDILIETRGLEHAKEIETELKNAQYRAEVIL